MDINMLLKLSEKPMGGNDFINFYYKKFGILMSGGTVYSNLYSLERKGLIKGFDTIQKRVYRLTKKGEELKKKLDNCFEDFQSFITAFLTE
jgi:DNA-binding PadR family transcriptional regulator